LSENLGDMAVTDSAFSKFGRNLFERIFGWDFLEKWLGRWQLKKIESNPKTSIKGSYIIANDKQLVFLPQPRGAEIVEKTKEILRKFSI
jgi:hypothetical protein